jgi:nicotinate-nucleotide adenylyltransferase
MSRLGILGGTFDPSHNGHLVLAQSALEFLKLDKVIFVPTAKHPHKQHLKITDPKSRLDMLKLALDINARFEISEIEINRAGLSYTCDTLREFKKLFTDAVLYLIIGGDNISDIETWKYPEGIFSLAEVAAAMRPLSSPAGKYKDRIKIIDMPPIDISSTMIREYVKQGKSIKGLVPASVENYIKKNGLYR